VERRGAKTRRVNKLPQNAGGKLAYTLLRALEMTTGWGTKSQAEEKVKPCQLILGPYPSTENQAPPGV